MTSIRRTSYSDRDKLCNFKSSKFQAISSTSRARLPLIARRLLERPQLIAPQPRWGRFFSNPTWPPLPRHQRRSFSLALSFAVLEPAVWAHGRCRTWANGLNVTLGRRRATPLHERDGVIRFQHRRKISSILIRNTVVPIAIRTTLGSLAIERVKSPKTWSCYEYHSPGRSKTVRTAVGRSIFPVNGIGLTSKPSKRKTHRVEAAGSTE